MNECCAAVVEGRDLVQILAFGVLISAGHCLGMCGPLACAGSWPSRRDAGASEIGASIVAYHAGRLLSYAAIGVLLGSLGSLIPAEANARAWQAALSILAALALVWVGLGMLGWFPIASPSCARSFAPGVVRAFARLGGTRPIVRKLGLGIANGLLPCGPVYTVALAALVSSGPLHGATAMLVFGAGTVPLLVASTCGWRWIGARLRASFARAGAVFAVAMGVQLALRGFGALEWIPHARIREVVLW